MWLQLIAPAIPASPATVAVAARLIQPSAVLVRGSAVPPGATTGRVISRP
jgi:hypothetical protein